MALVIALELFAYMLVIRGIYNPGITLTALATGRAAFCAERLLIAKQVLDTNSALGAERRLRRCTFKSPYRLAVTARLLVATFEGHGGGGGSERCSISTTASSVLAAFTATAAALEQWCTLVVVLAHGMKL